MTTPPLQLGFIGLGIMGAPMCSHLIAAGHQLFVNTRGKVPAAIHVSPEAVDGGMIAKVHTGDWMTLDSEHGVLQLEVPEEELNARAMAQKPVAETEYWLDLFSVARKNVGRAELGATWLIEDTK